MESELLAVLGRCLVTCGCGFQWFSRDGRAAKRAIEVHRSTCQLPPAIAEDLRAVQIVTQVGVWEPDPAHHCRENEPPQIPPPSRADADGACSWNCRGSYSWNCFCPCQGERHGENHLWDPDERAKELESIYGRIARAKPRGDWPGRKST